MKRYVCLLASLLTLWGLAGCDKSDGEDIGKSVSITLSQSEITAENGKISVEMQIDGFEIGRAHV